MVEVRVCHVRDVKETVKWCYQGVAGKAKLICLCISLFFLVLTILVFIMEKSVR